MTVKSGNEPQARDDAARLNSELDAAMTSGAIRVGVGVFAIVGLGTAFLVSPVGGKAALGLFVHFLASNLDLDPHLGIVNHRGVQRLIAVALGRRDIILEAARDHRPAAVDQAQCAVRLTDVFDDDPERHHVRQLLEADVPLSHLLPDRIRMFLAAGDHGLEAVVGEVELQAEADAVDEIAALFG